MWRLLALSLVFAGCGDGGSQPAADAAVLRTPRFTPLLCTAGNPGDATCPINNVDLTFAAGASFSFVASPTAQALYVTNMRLVGSSTLKITGAYLEAWSGDALTASVLIATSLDGTSSPGAITIVGFIADTQLALRFDAITSP